jgi:hypothetical protein
MHEVKYLGHVVSANGIGPDPEKVRVMRDLKPPTTVKGVRSFIGMGSYYRRFVPEFAELARPLTQLTHKHAHFEWNESHQKSFDALKQRLSSAPILAHPDLSREFIVYTDASQYAVGAVLAQKFDDGEKVIQYLSHQLSGSQKKWPTIEREMYAIIFAIKKLRHYLLGHRFTIFCDHKPLRYLMTAEMKNARVQRWGIMLDEFNYEIKYKTGKSNVHADLLSRIPDESNQSSGVDIDVINSNDPEPDMGEFDKIADLEKKDMSYSLGIGISMPNQQAQDPAILDLIEALHNQDPKVSSEFIVDDDILYHVSTPTRSDPSPRLQLVIPDNMRATIMHEMHAAEHSGHVGLEKTYDRVRTRYFWKNMFKDIAEYIQRCQVCNIRKLRKKRAPLQDMPVAEYPFEIVSIDTVGPMVESTQGNRWIVTLVDHFSLSRGF